MKTTLEYKLEDDKNPRLKIIINGNPYISSDLAEIIRVFLREKTSLIEV